MKKFLIVLLIALLPLALTAQTTVRTGRPLTISAPHDGLDTHWYNLVINGKRIAFVTMAAWKDGIVTFTLPEGLPVGEHVARIEACSDAYDGSTPDKACPSSDPWVVVVKPKIPGAPEPPIGVTVKEGA